MSASTQRFDLEGASDLRTKGVIPLAATTAAWIITMSTLYTGAILVTGMGIERALLAAVFGMLFLAFVTALQSFIGAKSGMSTAELSAVVFGALTGRIIAVVIAFVLGVGWFAWQLSFLGLTISAFFEDAFLARPQAAIVWSGALIMGTTLVGFRALSALSVVAVPLIVLLSVWGIAKSILLSGGLSALSLAGGGSETMTMAAGISIVIGNGVIGAVVMPDIARFGKTATQAAGATAIGYFFGGLFLIAAGATVTVATGQVDGDLPVALRNIGLGQAGFLILFFAQWTTNNNNLYSASVSLASVVPIQRAKLVIPMGIIGLFIALFGIHEHFVPLLNFLGILFAPLAGTIVGFYTNRDRNKIVPNSALRFSPVIIFLFSILVSHVQDYFIGPLFGFIFAAILSFCFSRYFSAHKPYRHS